MKFSEIQYERPNIDALVAEYDALIEKIDNAASAKEQLDCVMQHEKLFSNVMTMVAYAYICHSVDTRDAFYEKEQEFLDENGPLFQEKLQGLYAALLKSKFRPELEESLGKLFFLNMEIANKTFTPENIPLMQEEAKLTTEYSKLLASASMEFDGETVNLTQLRKYEESKDRDVRRRAYAAEASFFKAHEAEFDRIFDQLVALRNQMARNMGYENFIELGYYRMNRNCYDAGMVAVYREQVVKDILPTVVKLKEKQAKRNGLSELMFYDNACMYPEGNPKPQAGFDEMLELGRKMYHEMSPETAEFIDYMIDNELFDPIAKAGKQPGGYCTYLPDYKLPFIFANFNGTSADVDVLTHEAGHAYQAYRARNMEIQELSQATLEACEVHSMSMEFFCYPYLELFYGDDADRAREAHLTDAVSFLPYGCMVDEFQHIIYENPQLSPDERKAAWAKLEEKYRPFLRFEGDFFGEGMWFMRQSHIYKDPFYYIDYCLAQTAALQFWAWAQKDRDAAFAAYNALVEKAGTETFLELVTGAGLRSPFTEGCLEDVAKEVEKNLL
jgi:M3 family oligoendopeptidase